jgi:hypothetical protein
LEPGEAMQKGLALLLKKRHEAIATLRPAKAAPVR